MNVSTAPRNRSKAPRGQTSKSDRRSSASGEPVRVTKRPNVECEFDTLVARLAEKAKLGLNLEQKLLAKLHAMHILVGITRMDPMFEGLSGALFAENGMDITCRRNLQAASQGIQHEEFLPKFGIKESARGEPSLLRGHGITSSGEPVVIPFERLFGAELSHGVARYMVRFMKARNRNGWPNSVRSGEKKETWVSYAATK
jgi:hypothetical protein